MRLFLAKADLLTRVLALASVLLLPPNLTLGHGDPSRLAAAAVSRLQRKSTLSSSQFASVYQALSPCLEEVVCSMQTDAGGRVECTKDLKDHERQASIGYALR